MREYIVSTLFLLFTLPVAEQNVPAGWRVVKDSRSICQIAVPPEWVLLEESTGAAVLQNTTTAIAVVTSQPDQTFRPLTEFLQKVVVTRKDKMFENSARRIFYQDKISRNSGDPNAYTASVPARGGTCSGRVTFLPIVSEETAKKIMLSLGPAAD